MVGEESREGPALSGPGPWGGIGAFLGRAMHGGRDGARPSPQAGCGAGGVCEGREGPALSGPGPWGGIGAFLGRAMHGGRDGARPSPQAGSEAGGRCGSREGPALSGPSPRDVTGAFLGRAMHCGRDGARPSPQAGCGADGWSVAPGDGKEFALIRPVVGGGDEAFADGVGAEVFPFGGEVFAGADLGVPALALPEGAGVGEGEGKGDFGFPVFHPAVEIGNGERAGTAEEMDVIGHDDIAADQPVFGGTPGVEKAGVGVWMGEYGLTVVGDGGHEEDDGAAVAGAFMDGVAGRAATGGEGWGRLGTGVHGGRMAEKGTGVQFAFGDDGRDEARPSREEDRAMVGEESREGPALSGPGFLVT